MKYGIAPGILKCSSEEASEKAAKEGYDGIEWGLPGDAILTPDQRKELPAAARRLKKISEENGLEIVSVTPGLFLRYVRERNSVRAYMDAICSMGCNRMRMTGGIPYYRVKTEDEYGKWYDGKKDYWTLYSESQKDLEILVKDAEEFGVRVVFELHHGYVFQSCSVAYHLLHDFDPKYVGGLHDADNMVHEGHENWLMGFEILSDYLSYLHVKNIVWERDEKGRWQPRRVALGEGLVPWRQIVGILKQRCFEDYLVNEDLRLDASPDEKLTEFLPYMRSIS